MKRLMKLYDYSFYLAWSSSKSFQWSDTSARWAFDIPLFLLLSFILCVLGGVLKYFGVGTDILSPIIGFGSILIGFIIILWNNYYLNAKENAHRIIEEYENVEDLKVKKHVWLMYLVTLIIALAWLQGFMFVTPDGKGFFF